jgi:hypothetical protein
LFKGKKVVVFGVPARLPRLGENHGTVRAGLSVCDPLGRGSVESAGRAIIWWREVRIQAFPQGGFGSAVIIFPGLISPI